MTIFRATRIDAQQRAEAVVYLAGILDATRALNTVVQGAQSAFAELTHTPEDTKLAPWCAASARLVRDYVAGIIRWHASTSPPLPLAHLRHRVDAYYRSVESAYCAVAEAFCGAEHESDPNVHLANYRLFVERYRSYSAAGQRANAEFRKAMLRFRISEEDILPQEPAGESSATRRPPGTAHRGPPAA